MALITQYSSMNDIKKGNISIIGTDEKKNYLFSNIYEVAKNSSLHERVVVAKNLEYTIEISRAEGKSPWYICAHDETVVCMEGKSEIRFVKPDDPNIVPTDDKEGVVKLETSPRGAYMGHVKIGFGHQALLPAGAAYQYISSTPSVLMFQSLLGDESIQRWNEICDS